MKKDCYGCRALYQEQYFSRCSLGFKHDDINHKPLEECPKPRTNYKLVEIGMANAMAASNNKFEPTRE